MIILHYINKKYIDNLENKYKIVKFTNVVKIMPETDDVNLLERFSNKKIT